LYWYESTKKAIKYADISQFWGNIFPFFKKKWKNHSFVGLILMWNHQKRNNICWYFLKFVNCKFIIRLHTIIERYVNFEFILRLGKHVYQNGYTIYLWRKVLEIQVEKNLCVKDSAVNQRSTYGVRQKRKGFIFWECPRTMISLRPPGSTQMIGFSNGLLQSQANDHIFHLKKTDHKTIQVSSRYISLTSAQDQHLSEK